MCLLALVPQHRPREPHLRVRRACGDAILRQHWRLDRAGSVGPDPAGRGAGVQGGGVHGAVGRPAVTREQGAVVLLLLLLLLLPLLTAACVVVVVADGIGFGEAFAEACGAGRPYKHKCS